MDKSIELSIKYIDSPETCINLSEKRTTYNIGNVEKYFKTVVYMDKKAQIFINTDADEVEFARLFINDVEIDAKFSNGFFSNSRNLFFSDIIGYAELSVYIKYTNDEAVTFYSDFLPVVSKDEKLIENMQNMISYIEKHHNEFLMMEGNKSLYALGSAQTNIRTIEYLLRFGQRIANLYSDQYIFFKNNHKKKLVRTPFISKYTDASTIDNTSILYAVQHPDNLLKTPNGCIVVGDNRYTPQKISTNKLQYSPDVIENELILNFLYTVALYIRKIKEYLQDVVANTNIPFSNHCFYSPIKTVFDITRKNAQKLLSMANACCESMNKMLVSYNSIFSFKHRTLLGCPPVTPHFARIKEYRSIYNCIYEWFNLGLCDTSKETILLSFLTNNKLYEYYILLKLCNFFKNEGYKSTSIKRHIYRTNDEISNIPNTFEFKNLDSVVTLYYQPIVFLKQSARSNGISLLRNNTISFNLEFESSGKYYSPDFIIKVENDKKCNYLIMDTKYSTAKNVKSFYLPTLVYKYIFSLTPIDDSNIVGLWAINGKNDNADNFANIESIYTSETPLNKVPDVSILTIIESSSEKDTNVDCKHFAMLKDAFTSLITL